MDVREIRCPGCFAPVDMSRGPVASCRFCGATLAVQGGAAVAAPAAPPGTIFLESAGKNLIGVIKVVREHTRLGLKEAKDLVDAAPCVVAQWNDPAKLEAFRRDLVEAGARVR